MRPCCVALCVAVLVVCCLATKYEKGEYVPFKVSKIGPYSNPSETYDYYSLPFCRPDKTHKHASFKDELAGDLWARAVYDLHFAEDTEKVSCSVQLSKQEINAFKRAIRRYYYFEMSFDDLPIRGFIGRMNPAQGANREHILFQHLHFTVLYNGPHVIYANVSADINREIVLGDEPTMSFDFTYSVNWVPTDVPYEERKTLGWQDQFFASQLEVQWLSILNSFVLVILLTGFICIILFRVLKGDYLRYSEDDDNEDSGWKLIHGDVFRLPQNKMLLSALLGNGLQFVLLVFLLLGLALLGYYYPGSGHSVELGGIIIYALTSGFAGYTACNFYKQLGGTRWAWCIVTTSCLFALPTFLVVEVLDIVASLYSPDLTVVLSFGLKVFVASIWLFVGFPLTLVGGIIGKNTAKEFKAPVRTKNFAREIPLAPWYRSPLVHYFFGGFLPFSAIYVELYQLFEAVFSHSSYVLFSIMFLVFIILLIVTSSVTVTLTYFQLSLEDHRWWDRSFITGGSAAFFIAAYSTYYYLYDSLMTGALQTSFFFGYMSLVCYFFFIMLGSVGFYSSLVFVRYIYSQVRVE